MRGATAVLMGVLVTVGLVASAGPGNGTDPTPGASTIYAHVDADTGDFWMSNTLSEDNRFDGGWGFGNPGIAPPGLGSFSWTFPLDPAPAAAIEVDGSVTMTVRVGASGFLGAPSAAYIAVTPYVMVDGATFVSGETLESEYVAGYVTFTWTLTPQMDTIPAGAEVSWTIEASGVFTNMYLWMGEDEPTRFDLPVVAPSGPEPSPSPSPSVSPSTSPSPSASPTPSNSPSPSGSPTPSTEPSTEPSPTPTCDPATEDCATDNESPGAALVAVLALLGLAAVIRRNV